MKRRARRRARLACVGVLLACSACDAGPRQQAERAGPVATRQETPDARVAQLRPARREAKPRTVSVKTASVGTSALQAGARLGAHETVALPEGADVTLDFEHGARVHIVGPAAAATSLDTSDALLLRQGVVGVDLAPAAPTPDSGFTLFTPSAKLSLVRGGRYAIRAFADGVCRVFVASGSLSVSSASGEGVRLAAEETALVGLDGAVQRAPHTVQTLERAEQAARALVQPKARVAPPPVLDALLSQRIEAALPLLTRERDLMRRHRSLRGVADAGLLEVQRELAENAARLSEALGRLRTAYAQRAAARLGLEAGGDALGAKAQRILERLP